MLLASSCTILVNTPHETLSEGFYRRAVAEEEESRIYLDWEDDTLRIYALEERNGEIFRAATYDFPPLVGEAVSGEMILVEPSLDLDFMTILFKYRPPEASLPRQLNSDLSGALYLGYRRDVYRINYSPVIPGMHTRQISHIGYSGGAFAGFGASAINPWVTEDLVQKEYEGVVATTGVAALLGVGQFTLGLAVGWDWLLDANNQYWIYQGRPWFGFTIGLNLN